APASVSEPASVNASSRLLAKDARNEAPAAVVVPGGASGGVDGQQVPHTDSVRVRNDIAETSGASSIISASAASAPVVADAASAVPQAVAPQASDNYLRDEAGNLVTIYAQAEGRVPPGNIVTQIPLDNIDKNPYQTRYLFDKELLEELADSIRANGVVQP